MDEIHIVNVRGTQYEVVELVSVTREKINPFNSLRLKRGPLVYRYRILGSEHLLTLSELEHERLYSDLKTVPDFRSTYEKHPLLPIGLQILNLAWSGISVFL